MKFPKRYYASNVRLQRKYLVIRPEQQLLGRQLTTVQNLVQNLSIAQFPGMFSTCSCEILEKLLICLALIFLLCGDIWKCYWVVHVKVYVPLKLNLCSFLWRCLYGHMYIYRNIKAIFVLFQTSIINHKGVVWRNTEKSYW